MGSWSRRWLAAPLVCLLSLSSLAAAQAQAQAQAPPTEDVEIEPIACWWRTDAGAVRVGQSFSVILTCSVIETTSTKVVVDQSRLDGTVLQLPPFEVLGGRHADDLRTTSQRFFQYDYTLRLVSEDAFARDVALPALTISYRVETRTGSGAASQGREQTYELPPLPMRIEALVPSVAADLREPAPVTFAEIDRRTFRARALRVAAMACFAAAVVALIAGLVRRTRETTATVATRTAVGEAAIARAAARTLRDLAEQQRRGTWGLAELLRATAAMRVIGSLAIGRAVAQRPIADGAPATGELVIGGGLGRGAVAVSGSATGEALRRSAAASGADAALIDDTAAGLVALDLARYSATVNESPDVAAACDRAAELGRRVAARHGMVATGRAALTRQLARVRPGTAPA